MCMSLLEDAFGTALTDIIENEDHLIFQQDGAPLRCVVTVRQCLDQHFAGH